MKNTNSLDKGNAVTNKNKLKKRIIIVIISIAVLIALMFISVLVLDLVLDSIRNKEEEYDFNFYEADYGEDIFEDPEYISLIENGYISFSDVDNVTLGIDEDDAKTYGKDIEFMVQYVKYMINGDVKNYNACYSDLYYEKEKPKDNFTMQKIYDVTIKRISEQSITDGGQTYMKYVISLNYKILKNNGTLRNDFLNGSRTQYVYITDRSGKLKIDGITVLKTAVQ